VPLRSRRLLAVATSTLLATSLALAGCSGDDEEPGAAPSASPSVSEGSVLESTWPFTGLPVKGSDSSALDRPLLVTKIDNSSSSAPQRGLSKADLVVEELVEGGTTRLAAFFYSRLPDVAGPVRSMRASDITFVPQDARIVTSGAAPVTIKRVRDAGIRFYNERSTGFFRESGRSAPYNLFVRLKQLARTATVKETRPDDYLPWGTEEDLPKGKPAGSLAASFGNHTTQWVFDRKRERYRSPGSYAGDAFPADSVLVLRVPVGDAGYRDPAGAPVPESRLRGSGAALLFHGGRVVRATWTKKKPEAPLRLQKGEKELTVPAGHTWIEMVPAGSRGAVTWSR
jgi:hypothetical protein